jgi:hypothetical protein
MKYSLNLLAVIVLAAPLQVHADTNIYQCEVMSDAYIKGDGSLEILQDNSRIGQKFTVMKKAGEVFGDVMDALKNPKVISSGGEKNSYKVLWIQKTVSKTGAFVDYLNIDEFVKGEKKPFGFFSGSLLLTGLCE